MHKSFDLIELGVNTTFEIYNPGENKPENLNQLFEKAAGRMWYQAEQAMKAAEKHNINYKWYAQTMHPKSENEKYRFGYWLQFYIFTDLYNRAGNTNNNSLKIKTLNAYFGQNWESFNF